VKRIEKQNAGLAGWRITFSSELTEKGRFLIAIDERSADVIKNQSFGIF
jgi:hypothetical protein